MIRSGATHFQVFISNWRDVARFWNCLLCAVNIKFFRAIYRGADKSLARPGRKQATATEDFDIHISYL
jgi:hypothetical protein